MLFVLPSQSWHTYFSGIAITDQKSAEKSDDQLTLIDIKGFKINNIFSRSDRKDLPLIVGIDGNLNVQEALKIYQILSNNIKEIRGLIRIGKRRWDVILKSNKRIKLPEKNPKKSLKKFLNSDLNYLISSNKFSVIDLRFINRIVLRKVTEQKQ